MAEIGENMRAVIMENIGRPRVLKYSRLPLPALGAGEVLVKVHAASVNSRDLLLRRGRSRYIVRKPMPHILGGDLAGEIVEIADDVTDWEIGDRAATCFEQLGCEIDGAYAEFCALPADQLTRMPQELDFQAAVAAGASFAAAHLALVSNGKLKKADTVVIQGAASDIGTAAVQIARAKGAKVIAISESAFASQLREIGADIVLEHANDDLVRQVKVTTDENGASLILHCGEDIDLPQSLDMLAYGGRLVISAALRKPETRLNATELYLKNLSVIGSYGSIKPKDFESILKNLAKGSFQPLIAEVLPLSQARGAHQKLEKTRIFGKIVLVPDAILKAAEKPANWIPIE